jgi:hypothetical protein
METIVKAIDKAVRAGAYTLEETSIILVELEKVGKIVAEHEAKLGDKKEKLK